MDFRKLVLFYVPYISQQAADLVSLFVWFLCNLVGACNISSIAVSTIT